MALRSEEKLAAKAQTKMVDNSKTITESQIQSLSKQLRHQWAIIRRQSVNSLQQQLSRNRHLSKMVRTDPFALKIISLLDLMDNYKSDGLEDEAFDIIMSSPIYQRMDQYKDASDGFSYEDHLVKELLRWFKEDFFTWINKPPCGKCGNTDQDKITPMGGVRPYLKEHFDGRASVIERYRCECCHSTIEFPRYNNPEALLKTRSGRCGEWNNCFILFLKSLGIKARYIWNLEDHVWCEYYSTNFGRWIHLDSCENAYDNPLLYNEGWGKKMSYVFAIADHYIVDVTDKYVDKKLNRTIPRDKISEADLKAVLSLTNLSLMANIIDDGLLLEVSSDLINDHMNMIKKSVTPDRVKEMLPRQSGSVQWTSERGENGN